MLGKVGNFFSEAKQELAKANWPTRHELIGSTLLVIVVTLILAVIIFGIDFVLSVLMRIATTI